MIAYMIGAGFFSINQGGERVGITMAFAAMSLGIALHSLCSRSERPMVLAGIFRNYKLLIAVVFVAAAVAVMITVPWVAALMGFEALSVGEWLAVAALLMIQLAVWEYPKLYVSVKF